MTPLASIIINNYNYGRFLADAIDSALEQAYAHVEVIVVDDGSTDDSRAVMERYGSRITSVYKNNGGQGSAYNAGFAASRGDVICFLDSDDTLVPAAIATAVRHLHDSGAIKVQWPLQFTDRHGATTGGVSTKRQPPENLHDLVLRDGPFYFFDLTTGCAMRREFLSQVLPMPETPYRNGADVYLITLAPVAGRITTLREPLGTYRSHGSNNFRDRPLDDNRLRNYIQRFEDYSEALREFLAKRGETVDPTAWKHRNFNYLWPTRLLAAKRDLMSLLAPGDQYLLINGNEWGLEQPLHDRIAVPFLSRDGKYWGPPADETQAIEELRSALGRGVRFAVIWWTQYWWFDEYPGFVAHLRQRGRCLLQNERLTVFEIASLHSGEVN